MNDPLRILAGAVASVFDMDYYAMSHGGIGGLVLVLILTAVATRSLRVGSRALLFGEAHASIEIPVQIALTFLAMYYVYALVLLQGI